MSSTVYVFGEFELNPSESRLLRNGIAIPLPKKALQMLVLMVRKSGHLIEKSELIETVWGDVFIEEGNVAVVVSMLRKALRDDRSHPRYIETVSKSGYRFVAEVRTVEAEENTTLAGVPESTLRTSTTLPMSARPSARYLPGLVALLPVIWLVLGLSASNRLTRAKADPSASTFQAAQTTTSASKAKGGKLSDEAREQYLVGRHYADRRTPDGLRRSIEYFQQAAMTDPQFSEAYSGIADSYSLLANYELEPAANDYPVAMAAGQRAVQLNEGLAEPHTSLGLLFFKYDWNWTKAEAEFRRSVQLNPNYTLAYIGYASCLAAEGRFDEAIRQTEQAAKVDPLFTVAYTEKGTVFYLSGQYQKSLAAFRQAADLDPYYNLAHLGLARDYAATKDYANAMAEFQKANQLQSYVDALIGNTEATLGDAGSARMKLKDLIKRSEREYVPAYDLALFYVGLGQHDRAVDSLEKAYEERSPHLAFLMVDPLFDSLRQEPRFQALLRKMRLLQTGSEADSPGQGSNSSND